MIEEVAQVRQAVQRESAPGLLEVKRLARERQAALDLFQLRGRERRRT